MGLLKVEMSIMFQQIRSGNWRPPDEDENLSNDSSTSA